MANGSADRARLLGRLGGELRRMGIATVMFHQVLADRMGLNVTDSRAFSILQQTGPVPAGRLAELTGLSTGAVTTIIDRLEAAGYVRREADPSDRRRVIVAPVEDARRDGEWEGLFRTVNERLRERMANYDNDDLALILDFLDTGIEFLREETTRLREEAESDDRTARG